MRVLWFTNHPCGSIRRHGGEVIRAGWMISLEDELKKQPDIELGVAFFSDDKESPFVFDGVKYYPLGESRPGNPIVRVLNRYKSIQNIDSERLPLMLAAIEDFRPDIVHAHGTEESFGIIAPALKELRIPLVVSIQGLLSPYVEKFFSGISRHYAFKFDSINEKIRQIGVNSIWRSYYERSIREREILRNTSYVFGRTFWDKACTLAVNPSIKYYVVNEILRPDFYNRIWKGTVSDKKAEKIKIVSTISGTIYKGLETVLKAADILSKYADFEFEWHIAGYDSQSKMVKLSELVSSVDSSSVNVIYHGSLNSDSLSSLLCSSDIYVQASHIENSPNSLCEAMLIGMPCIASFAGGTSSILVDGTEGALYQDGDPYVLAGLITDYVNDPDKAIAFAGHARGHAQRRHNKDSIIQELRIGYESILEDFYKKKI